MLSILCLNLVDAISLPWCFTDAVIRVLFIFTQDYHNTILTKRFTLPEIGHAFFILIMISYMEHSQHENVDLAALLLD